jgi:hypothetical protein
MAVETDEDRAIFLSPEDFGGEALYTPRDGGTSRTIAGIFDQPGSDWNPNRWPGHEYQMQQGAHITKTGPTFRCRASDLAGGGRRRDRLTIDGVEWEVLKREPDGTGMVVLTLQDVTDGDGGDP